MTKNHEKRIIEEFIDYYFQNRKAQYTKQEIQEHSQLISKGILCEIDSSVETVKIQEYSTALQEVVLELATSMLRKELPTNISLAIEFVNEFDRTIKIKYNCQRINDPFASLMRGLRGYVMYILHQRDFDVKAFILSLDLDKAQNNLSSIGRSFLGFLPLLNYSEKEVFEILKKFWGNEITQYDVMTGLRNLPSKDTTRANQLLRYAHDNNEPEHLKTDLLIGLYNAEETLTVEKLMEFLSTDLVVRLAVLGRISYKNEQEIQKAFEEIGTLEFEDLQIANQQSYLIGSIIKNNKTTDVIRSHAFKMYANFLNNGIPEVIRRIFQDVCFLEKFEPEKYVLLHIYLKRTNDFNIIDNFFAEYENPAYVFDLMMRLYTAKPDYRFSTALFNNAIRHSWNTKEFETEEQILNLFKQHTAFGMLGVKVICSAYHGVFQVDLQRLDRAEYQLNAINSISKHPHSFDKLLPLILPLRNSKLNGVRKRLQQSLAEKVFSSYHELILNLIKANITTNKRDREFLKPISDALESYKRLKGLKESINDLNPFENERDLMDLYFRLEKETQAKRMEEVYSMKGTFLEMAKNVDIVRGNSWKIGDREVSPLHKFESSMLVDSNSFLNPDLYEHSLNH